MYGRNKGEHKGNIQYWLRIRFRLLLTLKRRWFVYPKNVEVGVCSCGSSSYRTEALVYSSWSVYPQRRSVVARVVAAGISVSASAAASTTTASWAPRWVEVDWAKGHRHFVLKALCWSVAVMAGKEDFHTRFQCQLIK